MKSRSLIRKETLSVYWDANVVRRKLSTVDGQISCKKLIRREIVVEPFFFPATVSFPGSKKGSLIIQWETWLVLLVGRVIPDP